MPAIEDRIKAAEEKLKQLKTQQQKLEARKRAAESKKLRTEDTRRKILLGSMFLEQMNKNNESKAKLMGTLDSYLKRVDDRALFGLPPITATEKQAT